MTYVLSHHLVLYPCLTTPSQDRSSVVNVLLWAPFKRDADDQYGVTKQTGSYQECFYLLLILQSRCWSCSWYPGRVVKACCPCPSKCVGANLGYGRQTCLPVSYVSTHPLSIRYSFLTRYWSFEVAQPANLLVHPVSPTPGISATPPPPLLPPPPIKPNPSILKST